MKVLSRKYYFQVYFMHYLDTPHSINLNIHTYFIVTFGRAKRTFCFTGAIDVLLGAVVGRPISA